MTGYTTIDKIVRSLLADEGYNTLHPYLRYLHFALEGEKDWRTDFGFEIKTKELSIQPDMTVDFPKDMQQWSKLGITVGDRIVAFLNDSTLNTDPDCLQNDRSSYLAAIDDAEADYYQFTNYYKASTNQVVAPSFGARLPGFYAVDVRNKRFILSDEVSAKNVLLEYIPDSTCGPSSQTLVHNMAERLIKYYIQWKYACNKYGPESARAAGWERQYLDEYDLLLRRKNPLQYEDILNIVRKYRTTGLKD